MNALDNCTLCSRNCRVNRNKNELGYCRAGKEIKIARAALHMWEEPPISKGNGSGAVFFSYCNFNCVFCQNHEISHDNKGKVVSINKLADIFLNLQEQKANNINLVTPTHYVPQIIEALKIAKKNGLNIPVLYNTNGYDSIETLKSLEGYIDVYLPDFKYFDDKYALKYSKVQNYRMNALKAIDEMVRQTGKPVFDQNGLIKKGVIVRHLMLPGLLFDSKKVLDTLYRRYGDNIFISIMNQYIPIFDAKNYPEINKKLNPKHYDAIIDYALNLGIKNGFVQDEGTSSTSYIPEFNFDGVD